MHESCACSLCRENKRVSPVSCNENENYLLNTKNRYWLIIHHSGKV